MLVGAASITQTKEKIYIQGLPAGTSTSIKQQSRRPTSIKVDQCGNGKITTTVNPELIEVQSQIIEVAKLPLIEKPTCGKSGQLKGSGKEKTYILNRLPVNKSLIAQLIVAKSKKAKVNKCGFVALKRSQRLSGYAEQNVETIYSVNGQLLSKIPQGKDLVCSRQKSKPESKAATAPSEQN